MIPLPSPAFAAFDARIEKEFGIASYYRNRKARVRRLFAKGPNDYETRLRYSWLAEEALSTRLTLDGALILLDMAHRQHRRTPRHAIKLWARSFRLMNGETIFQVRLILRRMRRMRRSQPHAFLDVVGAMTSPVMAAAE